MTTERVSIVMPMFNAERTLDAAIRSIASQTWTNWELIIVDDGSTDRSATLARDWATTESRIQVLSSPEQLGPAGARNLAMTRATGRYIAFLDADDLWAPEKLAAQLEAMRATGAPFVFSSYVQFHDGSREGWLYRAPATATYAHMLGGNVIGCLTVLIDREALGQFRFDDGREILPKTIWRHLYAFIGHEDYSAWMRLLRVIETRGLPAPVGLPQPLAYHRLHPHSFSASKVRVAGYQFFIYRHMLRLSCWRSLSCFARYAFTSLLKRVDRRIRVSVPELV
jgi:teichuronic acid biosynthesis glycosyltransferase TuaG